MAGGDDEQGLFALLAMMLGQRDRRLGRPGRDDGLGDRERRLRRYLPSLSQHARELEQKEQLPRTSFGLDMRLLTGKRFLKEDGLICPLLRRTRFGPWSRAERRAAVSCLIPNHRDTCMEMSHEALYNVAFSQSGNFLAAATRGDSVFVCDVRDLSTWKVHEVEARHVQWTVSSVDFTADERFFLYSSLHPVLHMVAVDPEYEMHEELPLAREGHGFATYQARFASGGREVVAACGDGCIRVLDVERKETVVQQRAHADDINSVVFADAASQPNVFCSGSDDHMIRVWDRRALTRDGRAAMTLPGHLAGISFLDSRQNGIHLLSNAKDQTVKLWDLRSAVPARSIETLPEEMQHDLYFDYRGSDFPGRGYRLWHPSDSSLMTYRGHEVTRTLIRARFSPKHSSGGRYIYSGSSSGAVFIWDAMSGELVSTLPQSPAPVRDVDWHPTLPTLVAASMDGSLRQWSARCNAKGIWDDDDDDDDAQERKEGGGEEGEGEGEEGEEEDLMFGRFERGGRRGMEATEADPTPIPANLCLEDLEADVSSIPELPPLGRRRRVPQEQDMEHIFASILRQRAAAEEDEEGGEEGEEDEDYEEEDDDERDESEGED